jgi:upstream activation factor subunit UAF30
MPTRRSRRRRRPPQAAARRTGSAAAAPSEALAAVVGPEPLPRGEVVSKVWDYIKSHNLQNPENRREILADDKLKSVFGKDKVTMFEMNKHLVRHLT